jgi:hypothetical protein
MEQWEKLRNPEFIATQEKEIRPPGAAEAAADITRDPKQFRSQIRARVFEFLRCLAHRDFAGGREQLANSLDWPPENLQQAFDAYCAEHETFRLDPEARKARHSYFQPIPETNTWRLQQMLLDREEYNDWVAEFTIDLDASRSASLPMLQLIRIAPFNDPR